MSAQVKDRARRPRRLVRWMRRRGWSYETPRNGLRRRLYCLALMHHPWWDWGHRVMALTGTDFGGNWTEPEPPTWWYRRVPAKPMWRTGYPRSTFEVVTDYDEFQRRTEGLGEDEMYEWKAICVNQDGALELGHRYWGKSFYGLPSDEVRVLRKYLRMWRRFDWFGLRTWLYHQGLHAAVHRKKPGSCKAVPPKGQGYNHWHCELPRGHEGMHRYRNYVWGDVGGEPIAAHMPERKR